MFFVLLPRRKISRLLLFFYGIKYGKLFDVDVIMSQDARSTGLAGLFISLILRKKSVVNVISSRIFDSYKKNIYGKFSLVVWFLAKIVLELCSIIRTLSVELKNRLIQEYFLNQEKIHVVKERVDLDLFYPIDEEPSEKVVGFIGRFITSKGIEYLMRAIQKVRDCVSDVRCFLVGNGPDMPRIKYLVRDLGINENVKFFGIIDHKKIPEFYRKINILALPSLVEGQPRVILEAMACGKPVIASNVGAVSSLVKHGYNGFLVEPGNVEQLVNYIKKILLDKNLAKSLGKKGRIVASQYKIDKGLRDMVALLRKAVQK